MRNMSKKTNRQIDNNTQNTIYNTQHNMNATEKLGASEGRADAVPRLAPVVLLML